MSRFNAIIGYRSLSLRSLRHDDSCPGDRDDDKQSERGNGTGRIQLTTRLKPYKHTENTNSTQEKIESVATPPGSPHRQESHGSLVAKSAKAKVVSSASLDTTATKRLTVTNPVVKVDDIALASPPSRARGSLRVPLVVSRESSVNDIS